MKKIFTAFLAMFGLLQEAQSAPASTSLLNLANLLSGNNLHVREDINLYLSNKNAYFKKHQRDLEERGIEEVGDVEPVIVLVDALSKNGKLIYADHKQPADETLIELSKQAAGALASFASYQQLVDYSKQQGSFNTLGNFLEGKFQQQLMNGFKETSFSLLVIDEDSDAYPLIIVPNNQIEHIKELAGASAIKLRKLN